MNVGSIATSCWNYAQRAAKIYPDFVLGTGNEAFSKALKETIKNRGSQGYFSALWDGTKKGIHATEVHNSNLIKKEGGFWRSTWEALKTAPNEITQGWKTGEQIAETVGKTGFSKFWSKFRGALGGVSKRMPLIGTLLAVIPEIPNLISAFTDGGLFSGVGETCKTTLRLGSGMTGAAIGQAIIPIPFVGAIVGYMAGDALMSVFTGKTYSQKKEEANQNLFAQNQQMQNEINQFSKLQNMQQQQFAQNNFGGLHIPPPTLNPQQLQQLQQMLYNNSLKAPMEQDFMAMSSGINNLGWG